MADFYTWTAEEAGLGVQEMGPYADFSKTKKAS
jgi:hypothetical protein